MVSIPAHSCGQASKTGRENPNAVKIGFMQGFRSCDIVSYLLSRF